MKRRSFLQVGLVAAGDTGANNFRAVPFYPALIEDQSGVAVTTTPFQIPRQVRQTAILVGNGGAVYGPFGFKIFDIEDVVVYLRVQGETGFTPAAVTVAKVGNLPLDNFTISFAVNISSAAQFVVSSDRIAERSTGVVNGGRIDPAALEKELSKQASTQQEVRRDIDRAVKVPFGERAPTFNIGTLGQVPVFDENGNLKPSNPLGTGNMMHELYDPSGLGGDVFKTDNFYGETLKIASVLPGKHALNIDKKGGANGYAIRVIGDGNSEMIYMNSQGESAPGVPVNDYAITRFDSEGGMIMGTPIAKAVGDISSTEGYFPRIQLFGFGGSATGSFVMGQFMNDGSYSTFFISKSRGLGSRNHAIVRNGDTLGRIAFMGDDGTDIKTLAASISAVVNAAPGVDKIPAKLSFITTDAAGAVAERAYLDSAGWHGKAVILTNTSDGAVTTPLNLINTGSTAGTAAKINFQLSTGGMRTGSIRMENQGGNAVDFVVGLSAGGSETDKFRVMSAGSIAIPDGVPAPAGNVAGFAQFWIDSVSKIFRWKSAAGVLWTVLTAPKTTSYSDDAAHSIVLTGMYSLIVFKGALTANRVYTVPNGAVDGQIVELWHKGSGAFDITLAGTGMSQKAAPNGAAKAVWDDDAGSWNSISYS